MRTLIGHEEFFVQRKDKSLWYYKMPLYGVGAPHATIGSDHTSRTRGGKLTFKALVLGEPTEMIPLDKYEQALRAKVMRPATGQLGKPYEAVAPLVYELGFYIMTFARNTPAGRVAGAVGLLLSAASGQSDGAQGVALGEMVTFLWSKSLLKVANLRNQWVVELGAEGIVQTLPLPANSSKQMSPEVRRLEKVLAFRYQVSREKLMLEMHELDRSLKKHLQQKYNSSRR